MKKRPEDLTKKEKIQTLDLLYTAASGVRGRDATKRFLRDLLTESERIMLGRRLWIARMLVQGASYDEIGRVLKVGYSTVYRIERWLKDDTSGYEEAIKSVEKEFSRRKRSPERAIVGWLKRTYR